MEEQLHYLWKHKIFPLLEPKTTDGRTVEVINPGLHNTDAGPDFTNAVVKIGDTVWVGNVEIHFRTSDWFKHGHDANNSYDNIILHVASIIDAELKYPNGTNIPQMQLEVPEYIQNNINALIKSEISPRCANVISYIPKIKIHNWVSALQVERLEERTAQILNRRDRLEKNWEDVLFVTIARNFGFGKNGYAFETWAHSLPMSALGKHRDSLFQIEALFFGQAGLLERDCQSKDVECGDIELEYYKKLQREYRYLATKFSLAPIDSNLWKFLRLRPQNFPTIRIAQLAMLYYSNQLNLSKLINADSIEELYDILQTKVSDYWRTHYSFLSDSSAENDKNISQSSKNLIIINGVVPILFAYGRYKEEESLCEKAISLWEEIKPEDNRIIRDWNAAGIKAENAADTQALIQLTHNYCDKRDCLRCRFGHEFISRNPGFLKEEN